MRLVFLHEYGAPSHYRGCILAAEKLGTEEVRYVEFGWMRRLVKSLLGRPGPSPTMILRDVIWLGALLLDPRRGDGYTVVLGMAPFDWRLLMIRRLVSRADVVYHSSWPDWSPGRAPKNPPSMVAPWVLAGWKRFLEREVDSIAAVTCTVLDSIRASYEVAEVPAAVVGHLIDEEDFHDEELRTEHERRLIFVGRLEPAKGWRSLVALARCHANLRFTIIGDGPDRAAVAEAAAALPNLEFLGRVDDKRALRAHFSRSHFIVQPSRRIDGWEELFGIALVEGMACGCVPLVTDHVGPSSVLSGTALSGWVLPEHRFLEDAGLLLSETTGTELDALRGAARTIARRYGRETVVPVWSDLLGS